MFIYSMRVSSVKFFSVIALTLAVLVGLLVFGGNDGETVYASSADIDFSGIITDEDRVRFISQFGIKLKSEQPTETEDFRVPESFDRVISGYNEIQKKQGLNIEKYKNKKVTRYTYEIADYEYEGKKASAVVNLVIYKGTMVACDISSSSPDGFVLPLVKL